MATEERATSWWVGRGLWIAGAGFAGYGAWVLVGQPVTWCVILGVAAMGIGNYVRHHKVLD